MKRRMISGVTGLGGGNKDLISGIPPKDTKLVEMINKCSKDCYDIFFKGTKNDEEYVDAGIDNGEIRIGIEPTYMFQPLKMYVFSKKKENSYYVTGYSFGGWGTGIRSKTVYYSDIKNNSKFIKFIDKWHGQLFDNKNIN